MFASFTAVLAAMATFASVEAAPATVATKRGVQTFTITPHQQYSSSVGVLGCKANVNRIAYFPSSVGCDDICIKVSHAGRSVHLLKVDQSQGAHDVSFDAYNYLVTGQSATVNPHPDGSVAMQVETVPASECAHLLHGGKLSLSAETSMNYYTACKSQPNSWVAKNVQLVNIKDSQCKYGHDEVCSYDASKSNQASCKHPLGSLADSGKRISEISYPSGKIVLAA